MKWSMLQKFQLNPKTPKECYEQSVCAERYHIYADAQWSKEVRFESSLHSFPIYISQAESLMTLQHECTL